MQRKPSEQERVKILQRIDQHSKALHEAAKKIVFYQGGLDPSLADDALGDAIEVFLEHEGLEEIDNPVGWAFTVTCNKARDLVRRERIRKTKSLNEPGGQSEGADLVAVLPAQADDFDLSLDIKEKYEIACKAIENLGGVRKKDIRAVLLRHYFGMTVSEIAACEGVGERCIYGRVSEGLKKIRKRLEGYVND